MKRFFYSLLPVVFAVLVVAAKGGVKPLCLCGFHQPEVPAALRK